MFFGVVIGVGVVVVVVGFVEGIIVGIIKEIEKFGINFVYVFINLVLKSEDVLVDEFLEFVRKNNDVILGVSFFV